MRHISINAFILLGVIGSGGNAGGEAPTSEIPADLVLERFAVAKNGDDLLVPVTVAGKDHLFVVDTAATATVFDVSLPLGQPIDVVTMTVPEKKIEIKVYNPPDAKIGRVSLRPLPGVLGEDLNLIRQVTGLPVLGILGTDFLGRHVVHIDVEKGELLILKSPPNGAGEGLPISWEPGGLPLVTGEVAPGASVRFVVDTGMGGLDSGTLGILEIQPLVRARQFQEIGKSLEVTISGIISRGLFQGGVLRVGEFSIRSPIFTESRGPTPNVLGRGFWSRFAVTLDFPGRKLYLRKSDHYEGPDRWNSTGLHLWRRLDSIEVHSVDQGSPADRAGLKKGDVIIELGGLNAEVTSCFDLFKVLCKGGRLTCIVRRDSQEQRLIISEAR
jgi:hypothetical protein